MKKLLVTIIAIISILSVSFAEYDISAMSDEELYALRLSVNEELAARANEQRDIAEGSTIAEIFPDEWLAKYIRDSLGKFSTKDTITQNDLNRITQIDVINKDSITTLEGVQYLQNLTWLQVLDQGSINKVPAWVGSLSQLTFLSFNRCAIDALPDSVCNLTNLKTLKVSGTNLIALPEDIGNLVNLKSLDISYTKITELPDSIYSLQLNTFNREGLELD